MVGPAEADIDFDIIKNDNDTFTVKYMPPGPGQYTIMVLFADQVRAQQVNHLCRPVGFNQANVSNECSNRKFPSALSE